jgi:mannose/fructose/N-acetylgalactosamine-specific phosphotransferase system component IID
MFSEFGILLPMVLLALGIFLVLKTHKPVWKVIGWVLVAVIGLLLVLLTRTGL